LALPAVVQSWTALGWDHRADDVGRCQLVTGGDLDCTGTTLGWRDPRSLGLQRSHRKSTFNHITLRWSYLKWSKYKTAKPHGVQNWKPRFSSSSTNSVITLTTALKIYLSIYLGRKWLWKEVSFDAVPKKTSSIEDEVMSRWQTQPLSSYLTSKTSVKHNENILWQC